MLRLVLKILLGIVSGVTAVVVILAGGILVAVLSDLPFFNPHTTYVTKKGSLAETEQYSLQLIVKALKEDPDLEYTEVFSTRSEGYGFVVNYNNKFRVLTLERDFCSGISQQFKEVYPSDLERIVHQKLAFDQLRNVLTSTLRDRNEQFIDVPRLNCL